jgi:tRNA A37 threonylcarbamoyladenosine dehydratase
MTSEIASGRRFVGITRLYGAAGAAAIARAHVAVVGIGGVGSWAVEALARCGVGRLTLIDLDHVAESNINRQIHALETTLGQAKVEAMRERVGSINTECVVTVIDDFIIDQVRAKAALIAHCRERGIAIVTTGGAGGRTDPSRIEVTDLSRTVQDPLASRVRAQLRKVYGFPRDPGKKFGVECVFSAEPIARPAGDTADCEIAEPGLQGLNCAGYGSVVTVTASFGMIAAARVLTRLAAI